MNTIKFTLHKRDRTMIANLYNIFNPIYVEKYSGINTLDFSIPYLIEDTLTHEMIPNPVIDAIKLFYLIKHNNEWFIIDQINKKSDEKSSMMEVKTYSLGYELKNKNLKDYKTGIISRPVKNLKDTVSDILTLTKCSWTVRNVDASLDIKYRAIDVSDKSVLDVLLNDICEKWDCSIKFDTENKVIDFLNYQTDGYDLGLYISENKYLKSADFSMEENSICTKLKVFGKNGISIQSVNPTGQNYITDYSYFKQDGYMTQGLITALSNYETAINNQNTTYQGYLTTLANLQVELATKQNELDLLMNDATTGLNNLQQQLDILEATDGDTSSIRSQIASQQALVDTKNSEISSVQSQIDSVNDNINTLANSLSINNYLSPEQISELNDYTIEKVYNDNSITEKGSTIDVLKELLQEAQKQLSLQNQPRFNLMLDLVDFIQAINVDINEKGKLKLGTIVTVRHSDLGLNLRCKIIEIEHDYFNFKKSIKIANDKSIKNGITTIKDILKNASATSSFVSLNSDNWANGGQANNVITQFLNNAIDTTTQEIIAGANQSVQINGRGITIVNPTNPQYVQRFTAGAWGLSKDGGQTFKTGASNGVIHAEILSGNIVISNEADFNSIKLYNPTNGNIDVEIGNYIASDGNTTKRGIKVSNAALEIVGGITESQLDNSVVDLINNQSTNILNDFISTTYNSDLQNIQSQIDGNVTTWFYDHEPTLLNLPSSQWDTTAKKDVHLGDIFYNTTNGYAYRFAYVNSTYQWIKITDSDITKALADASKAQDTADNKRRVFTSTPIPPYDIGDLWSQGATGDLMKCKTAKILGQSYNSSDWELATKYTDDTVANLAKESANTANNLLADISSDNKLTPNEKQLVKKEWDIIVNEYNTLLSQADTYGIVTEKNNYITEYSNLNVFLNGVTNSTNICIPNHGLVTGDIIYNESRMNPNSASNYALVTKIDDNNISVVIYSGVGISGQKAGDIIKKYRKDNNTSPAYFGTNYYCLAKTSYYGTINIGDYLINVTRGNAIAKIISEDSQYLYFYPSISGMTYNDTIKFGRWFENDVAEGNNYFADLTTTSDIVGSELRTKFANYYNQKVILLKSITDNAKTYTDNVLNSFIDNIYTDDKSNLQSQIDGKIESYFQSTDPNNWLVADRPKHNGDMWFNTATNELKRYNSSTNTWGLIQDKTAIDAYTLASTAKDTADGKRRVFTTTPTTPYDIGDLWSGGVNGDLKVCNNPKSSSQSYSISDWVNASKYTDDTRANEAISLLNDISNDDKLTPDEKQSLKKEWDTIYSEKPILLSQATLYSVVSTNYLNAFNTLETYITPLFTSLTTTSTIVGSTLRSNFQSYYTERTSLMNSITNALKNSSVQLGQSYNNLVFNSETGISATRGDNRIRTILNATDGIKIQKGSGDGLFPNDVLYFDTNGNGTFAGILNASDIKIDGTSILTVGNKIKADYIDVDNLTVSKALTLDASATISWSTQVSGKPYIPSTASDVGAVANNQSAVFNALTNNGNLRGLFMQDGKLYVSADYINTGTLKGINIIGGKFYGLGEDSAYMQIGVENGSNLGDLTLVRGSSGGNFFRIYDSTPGIELQTTDRYGNFIRFLNSFDDTTILYGTWDCGDAYFDNLIDINGNTYLTEGTGVKTGGSQKLKMQIYNNTLEVFLNDSTSPTLTLGSTGTATAVFG